MLEILLDATVRAGTPILFATLGAIINERAGIINLGIEGLMLIGALAGFAGTQASGSLLIGVLAAFVAALIAGSIHGFHHRAAARQPDRQRPGPDHVRHRHHRPVRPRHGRLDH